MEHLLIYFRHGIRDVIPYSQFISKCRISMAESGIGEYLGDDMAIDGGDAEGVFAGSSSKEIFAFIRKDLYALPFMKGARVTFIFGELEQGNPSEKFFI